MNLVITPSARKRLSKLPQYIQEKARKQFAYLLENYRHPSLRARKMEGANSYEARVDKNYRFTFQVENDFIYVLSIGPHDEGLGKK